MFELSAFSVFRLCPVGVWLLWILFFVVNSLRGRHCAIVNPPSCSPSSVCHAVYVVNGQLIYVAVYKMY